MPSLLPQRHLTRASLRSSKCMHAAAVNIEGTLGRLLPFVFKGREASLAHVHLMADVDQKDELGCTNDCVHLSRSTCLQW